MKDDEMICIPAAFLNPCKLTRKCLNEPMYHITSLCIIETQRHDCKVMPLGITDHVIRNYTIKVVAIIGVHLVSV